MNKLIFFYSSRKKLDTSEKRKSTKNSLRLRDSLYIPFIKVVGKIVRNISSMVGKKIFHGIHVFTLKSRDMAFLAKNDYISIKCKQKILVKNKKFSIFYIPSSIRRVFCTIANKLLYVVLWEDPPFYQKTRFKNLKR